ncbi:MAG: inositol monophosphatase family protein [Pirellulaceae bacterium]
MVCRITVTVAVERAGVIWAGAVYDPVMDECFHAGRGEGVWLDNQPLRGSGCERLENAMLAAELPHVAPRLGGSLSI